MKKTQLIDAKRNILKQIVSFLSILFISMLAVLTYLGINYSSEAIKKNASLFYNASNFRDAEISSTYLLTQSDLEAIRAVEGVSDVEGIYRVNCKVYQQSRITNVTVVSLTERINIPQVVEGRLPENPGECVVEQDVLEDTHSSIGDTISLLNDNHTMSNYLTRCDFVITGIVLHPDHSCTRTISPESRYVVILPEDFRPARFDNCYMSAEVEMSDDCYNIFDSDYIEFVSGTLDRLNSLADERSVIRFNEVRDQLNERIDEGYEQLDDASGALDDAREELDMRWQEYYDGIDQLNDAEQELIDAQSQLTEARTRLDQGAVQIEDGRAQLDDAWRQLCDARQQLDNTKAQLDDGWAQLEQGRIQLEEYARQIEQARSGLELFRAQLEAASIRLQAARDLLESGRTQLEAGYTQVQDTENRIRNTLREAIVIVLGEEIANRINWAEPSGPQDMSNPDLSATKLHITAGFTIDLEQSLEDNIFALLSTSGIPEADLRAAYESIRGEIIEASEESEVIQYIVNAVASAYNGIDLKYNEYVQLAQLWNSRHVDYLNGLARYGEAQTAFDRGMERYLEGQRALENSELEYQAGVQQYNDGLAQYNSAYAQYLDGEAQYDAALAEYNSRLAQFNQAEAQYLEGEAEYEEGLAQFREGRDAYEEGQQQIIDGRAALEEGEAELSSRFEMYDAGQVRLQNAIDEMKLMDQCHWTVVGVEGNLGFIQIRNDIKNVSDMGGTLAFVFVLVGALVIYATVGRIIEEQRNLVGASKALGLYNREIFMKYLLFGVTATAIGGVGGILVGYLIIQKIYLYLYSRNYVFDNRQLTIIVWLSIVVFLAGIAIASLTVWFACSNLMRSSAIVLMQDRVPDIKAKSKKSGSNKGRGSLYGRMIFLNMLADKKRVIVTIVSIAGSCTLLVAGMSLNFSINQAIDAEFEQVEVYDLRLDFDSNISDSVETHIENILNEYDVSYLPVSTNYSLYYFDGKISGFELITADIDRLNEFYVRRDPHSGSIITDQGDGIWIFQRLSETLDIGAGDELTLFDTALNPHRTQIAGVHTAYIGQHVIMSPEKYQEVFGREPRHNAFLVNLNGQDADELVNRFSMLKGFTESFDKAERHNHVKEVASVLNYVSAMFIICAGLMSVFILLNLINMYVYQKKRELIIMRINGFTVREVIHYVSLEIIVSTVLGIILGLILGSALSYRVILLLESIALHFMRNIQLGSWAIAALITVLFTFLVSWWALRKVKNLNLTDINN